MARKKIKSEKSVTAEVVDLPARVTSLETEVVPVEDRANNINSKELAMAKAGVTRRKTYGVICELLTAEKTVVSYGMKGEEIVSQEPDLDKRKQGAELALKAFGDLKDMQVVDRGKDFVRVVYEWRKS